MVDLGNYITGPVLTLNQWYWVVYRIKRESADFALNGQAELWVDGDSQGSLSNVHNWGMGDVILKAGNVYGFASPNMEQHFDQLIVSDSYPNPWPAGGGAMMLKGL